MSSVTSVPVTSATALIGISSDVTNLVSVVFVTQVSTKSKTNATSVLSIPAGASGVPPSSSLAVAGVSALPGVPTHSVSPQYKTVYVTKTAEPDANAATSDLPPGAIAGIAVGGFVVLGLIIGLVYFILRRRRKQVLQSFDTPRTSGSQTTVVGKKSEGDMLELYGTRDQTMYEANSKTVYEMEGSSIPELDGRSSSPESAKTPTVEAAARHIMSRGRPVRPGKG